MEEDAGEDGRHEPAGEEPEHHGVRMVTVSARMRAKKTHTERQDSTAPHVSTGNDRSGRM